MDVMFARARRTMLVVVGLASIGAGVWLVWHVVRPGVFAAVPTTHMVVLLGLMALPALAVGAWAWDRRTLREHPALPRDAGVEQTGELAKTDRSAHPGRDAVARTRDERHRRRVRAETGTRH